MNPCRSYPGLLPTTLGAALLARGDAVDFRSGAGRFLLSGAGESAAGAEAPAADARGMTRLFDLPALESLGLVRFTTLTSWTVEPSVFEGVLLSSLLEAVGADPAAATLRLIALNEFESTTPAADARTWPVMLALKRDGEYMSRRDRGPVWVIYPQHAFPELGQRDYLSRWVWQLKSIMVE
mgnify:CR=1 FL=1